jgi:hypothetical protein
MNVHLSLGLQDLGKGVSDSSTLGYKREIASPVPDSIFPIEAAILGLFSKKIQFPGSRGQTGLHAGN